MMFPYRFLTTHGACEPYRKLYREVFGQRSVEISEENLRIAIANELDIRWFFRQCLFLLYTRDHTAWDSYDDRRWELMRQYRDPPYTDLWYQLGLLAIEIVETYPEILRVPRSELK